MMKKIYGILSNTKIAVIGFLLVLIPCIILSYIDYQAINKRTRTIRSGYKFTLDLIRDKIEQEIISREEKLSGSLKEISANKESIKYLKSFLETSENQNPVITTPFLLNNEGAVVTPFISSEWIKNKIILPEVSKYVSTSFKSAQKEEFEKKDYLKSIELYGEALKNASPGDNAIIISAIGRCYYKDKNYKRAVGIYNQLLNNNMDNLSIGFVPAHVAALTQLATIYNKTREYQKRFTILLKLYKELINNPWNSSENEYNYYLKSASGELQSFIKMYQINDSTKKIITDLRKQELNIYKHENLAGFIQKNILPRIESLIKNQKPAKPLLQNFSYNDKDSVFQYGCYILPNDLQNTRQIIFGFKINEGYIFDNLLPEILNKIDIGNNIYAGVLNSKDKVLFPKDKPAVNNYLIAENFSKLFSNRKIALFDIDGKTINQQIIHEKQQSFLLFGLTIFVMIVGIVVLIISARHEYQISMLKSDFVSNVSHELKTPLSLIRMFGETLESGIVEDKNKRQEFYGIIKRESERLTDLINNVLDFSKIESRKKEFHFKEANITDTVKNVIESYKPQMISSGFQVDVKIPDKKIKLQIDKDTISQALLNLLNNAVKYSNDRKYICIEINETLDSVAVTVADHGIGIDRKDYKNIFENFYRVTNLQTSNVKGTGIGLTIAKYIVEAHKGTITVESEAGKGSKFTMIIPK
jgi:signal transduction histidine kinase